MNILFVIALIFCFICIYYQGKKINRIQVQVNELCKIVERKDLLLISIDDEDRELIFHLKKIGKDEEAIKKIEEITGLSYEEAKREYDKMS